MNKTIELAIPIAIRMAGSYEEPGGGVEIRIVSKCEDPESS